MSALRADLALIASLVRPGSRVLDLGCGSGMLLRHLTDQQGCTGTGVEIDPEAVLTAIRRGVPVVELDLDHQLGEFADGGREVLARALEIGLDLLDALVVFVLFRGQFFNPFLKAATSLPKPLPGETL